MVRRDRPRLWVPGWLILIAFGALAGVLALPFQDRHVAASQLEHVHLDLARLRAAIRNYAGDHPEWPGRLGGWQLRAQLIGTTDQEGQFGEGPDFPFGPYLNGELPDNPAGGGHSIVVVDQMPEGPTDGAAWIYCRQTGEIRPDTTAMTGDGRPFFDL